LTQPLENWLPVAALRIAFASEDVLIMAEATGDGRPAALLMEGYCTCCRRLVRAAPPPAEAFPDRADDLYCAVCSTPLRPPIVVARRAEPGQG
jgi:hypothetical protein